MSLVRLAVTCIVVYSVAAGFTRAMGMAPWLTGYGFRDPQGLSDLCFSLGVAFFEIIIMTPIEELQYLANLTCEACKWRIAEGDTRSGLEMEVDDRLARVNAEINGTANIPGINKKYSDKYAETHRRISINGKSQWVHIDQLEQVPSPNSRTGYKWRLKDQATEASDDGRTEEA